ncbi:alcohol dehydrogenase catalytic domain-containing protein [Streptomyces sp. NPDC088789]|uniref:alcohol dehydrogenase catalytic domain-containing protein n=1 Tax=Streptomyces sp. NPDC088789 TaxID=3365899 RepID=UPI00381AEEDD
MRALVYHGPAQTSWDTVPDPVIEEPTDAIVRVDATTVCGSDLHIRQGEFPEVKPGTILGHEAVGEVVETGERVHQLRSGDQVIVSSVSSCGHCGPCREARYGQCRGGGGWLLGNLVDGVQAELVRVPFADHSTSRLPSDLRLDDAVLLTELFPVAYEIGVRNGQVGPGDTVVVMGAGPVGLATASVARLYSPRRIIVVDRSAARLENAARVGADAAEMPGQAVAEVSEGPGADVVIEATGDPDGFELATRVVRTGGHIASVGTHGRPVTLHMEALWRKNIVISTGQVDTSSRPRLLELTRSGHLQVSPLITHTLPLDRMDDAYETFAHGTVNGALKVVLRRE